MEIKNLKTRIKNILGEDEFLDAQRKTPMLVDIAVAAALNTTTEDISKKLKAAVSINKLLTGTTEFSIEEIALMKEQVEKVYEPFVIFQINSILEP